MLKQFPLATLWKSSYTFHAQKTNPLYGCLRNYLTPAGTFCFQAMTNKWLWLEFSCLFLVALVFPRRLSKIATTRFPRFTRCSSAETSNAYVNLDSKSTPAQVHLSTPGASTETTTESRREVIASFLVSESDCLGCFDWNITEISHTVYKTSYKCTQIGKSGKSVFLKHLHPPPIDGNDFNILRYEFEGGGMRLRVNVSSHASRTQECSQNSTFCTT